MIYLQGEPSKMSSILACCSNLNTILITVYDLLYVSVLHKVPFSWKPPPSALSSRSRKRSSTKYASANARILGFLRSNQDMNFLWQPKFGSNDLAISIRHSHTYPESPKKKKIEKIPTAAQVRDINLIKVQEVRRAHMFRRLDSLVIEIF